jgi:gentisate 1,2-dioxygenase
MNRLEGGAQTRTTRTTANQIFCVAEGEGTSLVDGVELTWRRGDVFAAPGWRPFHHTASSDGATLFEMSDEPVMASLGWLRISD